MLWDRIFVTIVYVLQKLYSNNNCLNKIYGPEYLKFVVMISHEQSWVSNDLPPFSKIFFFPVYITLKKHQLVCKYIYVISSLGQ